MPSQHGKVRRIALFDMDGTVVQTRFVVELARSTGREAELWRWLDNRNVEPWDRSMRIAALFRGVPRTEFERIAQNLPLTPGICELTAKLKASGYKIGIVTDSYTVAAETVRRRIGAHFKIANVLRFRGGVCTGRLASSAAWLLESGCDSHLSCKGNALRYIAGRFGVDASRILAVGDNDNDVCMLRAAGVSVAFEPKTEAAREAGGFCLSGNMLGICQLPGVLPVPVDRIS